MILFQSASSFCLGTLTISFIILNFELLITSSIEFLKKISVSIICLNKFSTNGLMCGRGEKGGCVGHGNLNMNT